MKTHHKLFVLDLHRLHDGVWCALILPRYSVHAVARAFAATRFSAARLAVKKFHTTKE